MTSHVATGARRAGLSSEIGIMTKLDQRAAASAPCRFGTAFCASAMRRTTRFLNWNAVSLRLCAIFTKANVAMIRRVERDPRRPLDKQDRPGFRNRMAV